MTDDHKSATASFFYFNISEVLTWTPLLSAQCASSIGKVEIRNICIRQTGSGINPYHCSYGKISLMSNISKMVRETMLDSKEVR